MVVGITRVPELCVYGTTDSTYGITRNPWDLDRSPGGSSGGSAAAVASGTVPVAHGNDGMGSIRIPSACCGLVGIKPGLGVVPADLGDGSWFGMAENGPLATTVDDAALMLSVLAARPELADPADIGSLRIAVSTRVPGPTPLSRSWRAAATTSADLLRKAGHRVVEAHPPYGQVLALSEVVRWTAGTELDARGLADRSLLQPRVRRQAALGRAALAAGFPRERGRTRWREKAEHFFADHDVLLTPMLAQRPRRAREWGARGWLANIGSNAFYAPFAAPWNVAGWPAMSVPTGTDPAGNATGRPARRAAGKRVDPARRGATAGDCAALAAGRPRVRERLSGWRRPQACLARWARALARLPQTAIEHHCREPLRDSS